MMPAALVPTETVATMFCELAEDLILCERLTP